MCSRHTLDFDSRRSERRQLNQRGFDGSRASSFHSNPLSRTSEPADPACLSSCIHRSPNSGSTVISNKSQHNESAQPREATSCGSSRYSRAPTLLKGRARGIHKPSRSSDPKKDRHVLPTDEPPAVHLAQILCVGIRNFFRGGHVDKVKQGKISQQSQLGHVRNAEVRSTKTCVGTSNIAQKNHTVSPRQHCTENEPVILGHLSICRVVIPGFCADVLRLPTTPESTSTFAAAPKAHGKYHSYDIRRRHSIATRIGVKPTEPSVEADRPANSNSCTPSQLQHEVRFGRLFARSVSYLILFGLL